MTITIDATELDIGGGYLRPIWRNVGQWSANVTTDQTRVSFSVVDNEVRVRLDNIGDTARTYESAEVLRIRLA